LTEKPTSYPAKMNRGMAAKGADSLSLAAVCCVMPGKAIVGIVRRGKEAQVSHSGGMLDFHLRKDLLGRSDILTSQADSQS
jgi:(p)ppGpp synthase/HD superfamily hydrolase